MPTSGEVNNNKPKVIIFDFDGTLADTLDKIIEGYNTVVAKKMGSRKFDTEQLLDYKKNGTVVSLLSEHGISIARLPSLVYYIKRYLKNEMLTIPFFPGMAEVIRQLHARNFKLGILTSNSVKNVHAFLEKEKVQSFFHFVYSAKRWHGKDKTLKKIIRQEKLSLDDILYVGDEIRDINFARKVGIPIACVSWGMYHADRLSSRNPDFLAHSPDQLLHFLLNYP